MKTVNFYIDEASRADAIVEKFNGKDGVAMVSTPVLKVVDESISDEEIEVKGILVYSDQEWFENVLIIEVTNNDPKAVYKKFE